MDALSSSLERSPELFPHAYDVRTDAVSLIRLTRAEYDAASFLDGRVLGPHTLSRVLPWGQLEAAVATGKLEERCNYIFHIGHVGSTLLSRLLGARDTIFALREPAILRTFANMRNAPEFEPRAWSDKEFETRLSVFLKLWSRTFTPAATALIKATSYVSEMAPQLLGRANKPKAILLFVKPETYIATILAGPAARQEAKTVMAGRLARLHKRLGHAAWRLASFSEGEGLAMSWAAETSALLAARDAAGARGMLLDFDLFLASPREILTRTFAHLDCKVPVALAEAIVTSPLMQRYSKAPEHAYSPGLRRALLDEAHDLHGREITKGLDWLARVGDEFPLIRECLAAAGGDVQQL